MEQDAAFPGYWDTFQLFEWLLVEFEGLLERASHFRSSHPPGTAEHHAAVAGFLLFQPPEAWGKGQFEFISGTLEGDLSPEILAWYEETAPAVRMFACVALGALLGKYSAGAIDDRGFLLGQAHLFGFLVQQNEEIFSRYESYLARRF